MINVEYGFRRSGNHLLMETIHQNFVEKFQKCHAFADIRKDVIEGDINLEVFIVRDIRAVLASCYVWWRESGESRASGVQQQFLKYSFEDFVKGKVKLDANKIKIKKEIGVLKYDIERGVITNPVKAWIEHTESFLKTDMPKIRYETLVQRPIDVMLYLQKKLKLTPKRSFYIAIDYPVGHMPFRTGNWRKYYTEDLEEYVLALAERTLEKIKELCF